MAKIAVYNTFYEQGRAEDPVCDALMGSSHEVIGHSPLMRRAVEQMLEFADDGSENQPNLIIFGDRLEDERAYAADPISIDRPCKVIERAWYGRKKEVDGVQATFLLPYYTSLTDWSFPVVKGVAPKYPEIPQDSLFQGHGSAGSILTKIAKVYLPGAKRLGISSSIMDGDAELDGEVRRDFRGHIQQLRDEIARLTSNVAD